MDKPHKDQVVIITGGAGGIGSRMANTFANHDARVVIAGRDKGKLDKIADAITGNGKTCLALTCDVTDPVQVEKLVADTVEQFGRIDVLVNNAGGAMFVKPPEKLRPEQWRAAIDLNLNSVFYCSAAAGERMIDQNSGHIINISSVAGIKNSPAFVHYGAAKAGVINLTKSMAVCWGAHNINVNCIAPGLTATEGVAQWLPAKTREDGSPVPPLEYPPDPQNVADLTLFLASPGSARISGEIFPIRALNEIV
ncbi:MAG: SDR family NAD(P)-dependent oxidoreductase [Candidatus Azotimanducaceae bacterium]|jgi:NAD(P)-dependent dehydrogenase (short-subunit alcohol dehydrogenase family)